MTFEVVDLGPDHVLVRPTAGNVWRDDEIETYEARIDLGERKLKNGQRLTVLLPELWFTA